MATHSSTPAWRIPWTQEPGGLHPWGRKESDMTEQQQHNRIPWQQTTEEAPGTPPAEGLRLSGEPGVLEREWGH